MYEYPDSLTPVMMNHVGRHGARYATSSAKIKGVASILTRAKESGTITATGQRLLDLANKVIMLSDGKWGALDSLGMAEQRGIAARMFAGYPMLFTGQNITAISSYVPRCVMSMYSFCHEISRLSEKTSIITSSGVQNSPLMRPFDTDRDFRKYQKKRPYMDVLNEFKRADMPLEVARNAVGKGFSLTDDEAMQLTGDIYYLVSSCSAMGLTVDPTQYFSLEDYNRMWQADNLRQYLVRTANTISTVPSDIASALVMNLITTTQNFIDGTDPTPVHLRFGHAETILPLTSLLRLKGCYYLTNYFDTVAMHWQSFNIIPMAANVQMILFKSDTGRYYLRTDLNECPVPLIPGSDAIYVPWSQARDYMLRCVPVYGQQ
ncbi:MAG: histidine phosphatase family protein [Muribaculaceae bacterium]|nr:histidine phosphatase family protein [Muribaculaceae bacterium]